jgi:two-component system alkaline phosphatase synthesis response regulator PhoP
LVIEDDADIANLVKYNLEREGYRVLVAKDGQEGLDRIHASAPALVVLDLLLPKLDGLTLCRHLRDDARMKSIPVLMLTARGEEMDKLAGFEAGADDYLVKPFSPRELIARVKALLRRVEVPGKASIGRAGIRIDMERHEVTVRDKALDLTPKEFDLLALLMQHPGRVYTREQLLDRVWGYQFLGVSRTVDVHVRHLREKLGAKGKLIETVVGVGYRFSDED